MISARINATLACFFAAEVVSYLAAFLVWLLFFCAPPSSLPASDAHLYYKEANIFSVTIVVVLFITSLIRLRYEICNFSYKNSFSACKYFFQSFLYTSAIAASCCIFSSLYLKHISLKKILVIYLLTVFIDFVLKIALGLLLKRIYTSRANIRRVLIVGSNSRAMAFSRLIKKNSQLGFVCMGYVDVQPKKDADIVYLGTVDTVEDVLRVRAIDMVAIFLPIRSFYDTNKSIICTAENFGIPVYYMSKVFDPDKSKAYCSSLGQESNVLYYSAPIVAWQLQCKRVFDILFSVLLLLVIWPLMLVIAMYILCTSGWPVFFTQQRVGFNKRTFLMYKFRTMICNAENKISELQDMNEADGPAFKIKDDPRLIKGGSFLRRHSLDELPQLWNVLCGDMSAVGPRPLSLRDYGLMPEDWQRRRFSMKPGLTCIWQVSGRNEVTFDEWMQMDLVYIDTWRLKNDFIIILKTFYEVLRGGGK